MRKLHPKTPWTRFHEWIRHHHTAAYALAAAGVVIVSLFVGFVVMYRTPQPSANPSKVAQNVVKTPEAPKFYSNLTGKPVADEASTKMPATAIMLENSPDARPQSGLKEAGVVFEAVAEGGITRFLALYQQEKPGLVGPVRSLRPYYVDWLAPFDASVAHVGGSKFALDEIRNGKYRDIDQFFNGGSYWRAKDRYAPHNVYTNFERLDALNKSKNYTNSNVAGFARKDPAPAATATAKSISVTISGPLYNSSYTYDAANNNYARSQAGAPHTDREAGLISPNTVIVMQVAMQRVMEDGYREQITTTGSGKAHIFQDGIVTEATWTKPDRQSQLKFTDAAGIEVALNRGQTWITAIPNPPQGGVSWQ